MTKKHSSDIGGGRLANMHGAKHHGCKVYLLLVPVRRAKSNMVQVPRLLRYLACDLSSQDVMGYQERTGETEKQT